MDRTEEGDNVPGCGDVRGEGADCKGGKFMTRGKVQEARINVKPKRNDKKGSLKILRGKQRRPSADPGRCQPPLRRKVRRRSVARRRRGGGRAVPENRGNVRPMAGLEFLIVLLVFYSNVVV